MMRASSKSNKVSDSSSNPQKTDHFLFGNIQGTSQYSHLELNGPSNNNMMLATNIPNTNRNNFAREDVRTISRVYDN